YDIELRYVISRDDATMAASIQEAVESAIQSYIDWQRSKLGRDLNESELHFRIRKAGAKRVEIVSPTYKKVGDLQVAIPRNINAVYGGLEDD
ncbi:MAG: baseplate protein, partial [Schwartzia sp.]|nr:baseplate protein [Schwartzia sp. (in: firmicutes)]